jgi:hypothetical protein
MAVIQRKGSDADWSVSLFTALVFAVKLGNTKVLGV